MSVLDREKVISEYFDFTEIIDDSDCDEFNEWGTWEVCLKLGESAETFDLRLTICAYNMSLCNYGTDWAECFITQGKSYFKDEDALRDGLEHIRLSLIHLWQDIMLSCKPRPQASILD